MPAVAVAYIGVVVGAALPQKVAVVGEVGVGLLSRQLWDQAHDGQHQHGPA
jgi:hypothetical protein